METRIVNKRKPGNVKHHTEAKVRKRESIECLTKQVLIKKYKELEEKYDKIVSENNQLRQQNETLSEEVKCNKKEQIIQKATSQITTQTENLLDEPEYPCSNCVYVADVPEELGWHMKGDHGLGDPDYQYNFSCKICRKPFDVKSDLMYHIKVNHKKNMPLCKYFQYGNCHFSDAKCWYIHEKEDEVIKTFKCGYCCKDFKLKSEFMLHRKTEHNDSVKMCINYKYEKCHFKENCWYNHKEESIDLSSFSEY